MNARSATVLLAHEAYGFLPRARLNGRSEAGHVGHLAWALGVDGVVLSIEHSSDQKFARSVVPEAHDGEDCHAADSSAEVAS